MTRRTAWLAAVAGIAVGVLLFWCLRGGRPETRDSAEARIAAPSPIIVPMANAGHADTPQVKPPPPRVRRLAADERIALAAAITRARDRRMGATTTAPTDTAPPRLPAVDLTPADIQTSVREVIPMLAECFDQALPPHVRPRATTITAKFQVSGEPGVGSLIDSVELAADDHGLDDASFRECLQETLMAVALPPMPEGGQLEIHYPFVFRADP